MIHVKSPLNDTVTVAIGIRPDNTLTRCPKCGAEIPLDLSILRFFFPKGFNFLSVTDSQIAAVVDLINHRPRKCLDWCSSSDAFFSVVLT